MINPAEPLQQLDLDSPIDHGTTVLEASAGTGKTFALAHLALRLLAEEALPVERLLVVTFTRAAAAELKGRIRQRLNQAVEGIAALLSHGDVSTGSGSDPPLTLLLEQWRRQCSDDQLLQRLQRLLLAVEGLDRAPITTIHGFIEQLVKRCGSLLGVDPTAEINADDDLILQQLVADWRLRHLRHGPVQWLAWLAAAGCFSQAALLSLARHVDGDSDLTLGDPASETAAQQQFADGWATVEQQWPQWAPVLEQELAGLTRGRGKASLVKAVAAVTEQLAAFRNTAATANTAGAAVALRKTIDGELVKKFLHKKREKLPHPCRQWLKQLETWLHGPTEEMRRAFAHAVRRDAVRRRAEAFELNFADLLRCVDPRRLNATQRQGLQRLARQDVAACLIDEFQDTDPIQWRLFQLLFDGAVPLLLVGDPKQAIYRFRGGDIDTYLQATTAAADSQRRHACLTVNHRSDPQLVAALEGLLNRPDTFGGPIRFQKVRARDADSPQPAGLRYATASPQAQSPPSSGPLHPTASLVLRWVGDFSEQYQDMALKAALVPQVASEIAAALKSGLLLPDGNGERPLQPGDLAVLVQTNAQAQALLRALEQVGVGCRLARGGSIWCSEEADAWQLLLAALANPGNEKQAGSLAMSVIGGCSWAEQQQWQEEDWIRWLQQLKLAAERYAAAGPLPALTALLGSSALAALVSLPRGSQRLGDVRHIGEVLQEEWQRQQPSAARLAVWLDEQRALAHSEDPRYQSAVAEGHQQRLVTDGPRVTIATVHSSKGLEYGVVWCPFLWSIKPRRQSHTSFFSYHNPDDPTLGRCLELGRRPHHPEQAQHWRWAEVEQWQEGLRLAYVALTRARHQVVLHWGHICNTAPSPLAWLLQRPLLGSAVPTPEQQPWQLLEPLVRTTPAGHEKERLQQWLQQHNPGVLFQEQPLDPAVPQQPYVPQTAAAEPAVAAAADLAVAPWCREPFDQGWQQGSYSQLLRQHQRYGANQEPDASWLDSSRDADQGQEPLESSAVAAGVAPAAGPQPAMAWQDFPAHPTFGLFIHDLLEQLDFSAPYRGLDALRSDATSQQQLSELLQRHNRDPSEQPRLEEELMALMQARLGPLTAEPQQDALTLGTLEPSQCLRELQFHLPVAGGFHSHNPQQRVTAAALAACLEPDAAALPPGYLVRLSRLDSNLRGFLNGFIDLVFRQHLSDGQQRWFVADWKTNRLRGTEPEVLDAEMVHHHYPLQGALYAVALHRYLRQRLQGYDPAQHFGGVLYLFLRAMTPGASRGVWSWRPSMAVLHGLDHLLRDGAP